LTSVDELVVVGSPDEGGEVLFDERGERRSVIVRSNGNGRESFCEFFC